MNARPRFKLERLVRFSAFLFVLLGCSSSCLIAQQSAPASDKEAKPTSDLETKQVDLTLEDQPLAAVIAALSDRIGHGIVMDGRPLLVRGSFSLHTTAKAVLDQVAEYFDCSWTVGKHGAILMSKRFHLPGDRPQLHLKEMQKMAADLLSIWPENVSKVRMETYPFAAIPISPGNALFRALTSEQQKVLSSGSQLAFQDLSAEQKELMRLCILKGAAGNSHDVWDGLNARLSGMSSSYVQWHSISHIQLDAHPTPLQYSLEYVWPDLQDKGYERLVTARKVNAAREEKAK